MSSVAVVLGESMQIARNSYKRLAVNVVLAGLPSLYEAFKNIRQNNCRLHENSDRLHPHEVAIYRDALNGRSSYFKITATLGATYLVGLVTLLTGLFLHVHYAHDLAYGGGALAGAALLLGGGGAERARRIINRFDREKEEIEGTDKQGSGPTCATPLASARPTTSTTDAFYDDDEGEVSSKLGSPPLGAAYVRPLLGEEDE